LNSFGGHPMAAGFSLEAERIPEFRRGLARAVRSQRGEAPPGSALPIDAYLALPDLALELVSDLERLAPFGPGNPPLVLASRNIKLLSATVIGRGGEHLAMTVEDEQGNSARVLWWQGVGWEHPEGRFDLAYMARSSTFGGERSVQLEWVDYRPLEEPVLRLKPEEPVVEVVDLRQEAHPMPALERLVVQGSLQVWAEAEAYSQVGGSSRYALVLGPELAIWTTPPSRLELQAALGQVRPEVVYLFAVDPQDGTPEAFLKRLAGLVKYAINQNQGRASLKALAAATAQREATVHAGLDWLASRGYIRLLSDAEDDLVIAAGEGRESADVALITSRLKALLEETAAYRLYFRRGDKDIVML
jgi:single-stranded-DNA-specific exonuclease